MPPSPPPTPSPFEQVGRRTRQRPADRGQATTRPRYLACKRCWQARSPSSASRRSSERARAGGGPLPLVPSGAHLRRTAPGSHPPLPRLRGTFLVCARGLWYSSVLACCGRRPASPRVNKVNTPSKFFINDAVPPPVVDSTRPTAGVSKPSRRGVPGPRTSGTIYLNAGECQVNSNH